MSQMFGKKKVAELSFPQIILGHYKKILEIGVNEFRSGYYNYLMNGNVTQQQYVGDKIKEFSQAVELFALALYPHFDEVMEKAYTHYNSECDKIVKLTEKNEQIIKQLEVHKQLFRDLSGLLKRQDYFKGSQYSEGDYDLDGDDDDFEAEEGGEEE